MSQSRRMLEISHPQGVKKMSLVILHLPHKYILKKSTKNTEQLATFSCMKVQKYQKHRIYSELILKKIATGLKTLYLRYVIA